MKTSNFSLRIPPFLLHEAREVARVENISLNQLVTLALADRVAQLRTEAYLLSPEGRKVVNQTRLIIARQLAREGIGPRKRWRWARGWWERDPEPAFPSVREDPADGAIPLVEEE